MTRYIDEAASPLHQRCALIQMLRSVVCGTNVVALFVRELERLGMS